MSKIILMFATLTMTVSSFAGVSESWKRMIETEGNKYILTEVKGAVELLEQDMAAPVCGYSSSGIWATTALRLTLAGIRMQITGKLSVSQPALYSSYTICVTVSRE